MKCMKRRGVIARRRRSAEGRSVAAVVPEEVRLAAALALLRGLGRRPRLAIGLRLAEVLAAAERAPRRERREAGWAVAEDAALLRPLVLRRLLVGLRPRSIVWRRLVVAPVAARIGVVEQVALVPVLAVVA